ncbi:MAG: DNA polymerase III subunit delta, partial [Myxococcota bacterium]
EALVGYLEAPTPTTTLCLSGEKLDLRMKLGSRLSKGNALFVTEPPRQQNLATWLAQRAQRRGLAIDTDAARLLADLVGVDVGPLERALDKLAIYAGEGMSITVDHVEALVAPTRVHSVFSLTDAIGERDLARASTLLRNALEGGENALMLLTMIARQLRQLVRIQDIDAAGTVAADVASELGVPPFLVEPLRQQALHYRTDELARALRATARADVRLKSTRLAPGVVLEQLLLDVMPTEGAPQRARTTSRS